MSDNSPEAATHNPEADLALIRSMMEAGRQRAGVDGSHLIWWGALLSVTFFYQYAIVNGWAPNFGAMPWFLVTAIGWAGSLYFARKAGRACTEHNPALAAYGSAWMAVGITMILYLFSSFFSGENSPGSATILSSGVIGCAFFIMAQVLRLRPMFFAAAGWWGIMAYTLAVPDIQKGLILVLSGASLLLIFVPGLYLKKLAAGED